MKMASSPARTFSPWPQQVSGPIAPPLGWVNGAAQRGTAGNPVAGRSAAATAWLALPTVDFLPQDQVAVRLASYPESALSTRVMALKPPDLSFPATEIVPPNVAPAAMAAARLARNGVLHCGPESLSVADIPWGARVPGPSTTCSVGRSPLMMNSILSAPNTASS